VIQKYSSQYPETYPHLQHVMYEKTTQLLNSMNVFKSVQGVPVLKSMMSAYVTYKADSKENVYTRWFKYYRDKL
jgi:hypothetical protein